MGIITGSFGLILGLLFLALPKTMMKIFRFRGKGLYKEDEKIKFEIARPPLDKMWGEKKAVIFMRILGIIIIILSVFAFASNSAM